MAYWSAENATNAFLNTLMGQNSKEPNEAEFISALAAGNTSKLMVLVASSQDCVTNYTILTALSAAAYQTNSRVVCIFATIQNYQASIEELELHSVGGNIDFVVGHPTKLLLRNYKDADFVLADCENLKTYEDIVGQMQKRSANNNNGAAIIVGYNALCKGSTWQQCKSKTTHLLPIGRGLLVTRIPPSSSSTKPVTCTDESDVGCKKNRSKWVVKVDQFTGEEHVFRVRIPRGC